MPDARGLVEVSIRCERRVRNVGKHKGGSKDPWACGRGVRSYGRFLQESKATMLKEANACSRACVFNSRRKRTNANVSCLKPPVVDILVNSPAMQHIPGSAHGQRRIRGQGVTGTGDLTCHACWLCLEAHHGSLVTGFRPTSAAGRERSGVESQAGRLRMLTLFPGDVNIFFSSATSSSSVRAMLLSVYAPSRSVSGLLDCSTCVAFAAGWRRKVCFALLLAGARVVSPHVRK